MHADMSMSVLKGAQSKGIVDVCCVERIDMVSNPKSVLPRANDTKMELKASTVICKICHPFPALSALSDSYIVGEVDKSITYGTRFPLEPKSGAKARQNDVENSLQFRKLPKLSTALLHDDNGNYASRAVV